MVEGVNEQRVTEWAEALTSGNYVQGKERLREYAEVEAGDPWNAEFTYCCLGVGCDLMLRWNALPDAQWSNRQFITPLPDPENEDVIIDWGFDVLPPFYFWQKLGVPSKYISGDHDGADLDIPLQVLWSKLDDDLKGAILEAYDSTGSSGYVERAKEWLEGGNINPLVNSKLSFFNDHGLSFSQISRLIQYMLLGEIKVRVTPS